MQQDKAVRIPKQKRSIETKQKLKEAALQQITEIGYHQATTNSIAEAAGVNIGTLYAYYRDKKMVMLELLEEFQQVYYDRAFDSANQPEFATPLDSIRHDITKALNAFEGYEALFRESYTLQCMDKEVEAILRKYEGIEIQGIKEKLAKDWPNVKNRDQAALMVHSTIASMVNRYTLLGLPFSKDELADELASMLHSYLMSQS